MSRDHRKLRAFVLTDELVVSVYKHTRDFPREEMFGLTSQLRRSSISVAANIVEGAARSGEQEFKNFLNIGLGSLRETGYYIDLATRLGLLESRAANELSAQYEECAKVLSGLLRSIGKSKVHPRSAMPPKRNGNQGAVTQDSRPRTQD